ncbi:hypothetical protein SAMN05421820_107157 [Pedobacter steynii]|uniref:Uncharacterized protein n=1 Tax=Pedobacter steynii TaxID=430522 RepID=A0A1H0APD1_9SPHI|nr:hypothetical protein [Pedobacter steynii]NQX41301.1 hypothetical protein [Pedobacter steynii]SDN35204.1 hypothetical protein SAMN05421820_107157 [Pedobacter steynii]
MKCIYLFGMLLLSSICSFGQTNHFPADGNVGVGTTIPQYKFHIVGGHAGTNMNLFYYDPNPARQANLSLWASEPGWTYSGAGIGNNVINGNGISTKVGLINNVKGGSYMRLLDQEIRLNVISPDGTDLSALAIDPSGNIGIGTIVPKEKLSVNGNIRAREIKVEVGNWPDYVFDERYSLTPLKELQKYIVLNKHLPEIPKAAEAELNGVDLGEMNKKLLKKVEELTLYLIEQENKNIATTDLVKALEQRLLNLEKRSSANK